MQFPITIGLHRSRILEGALLAATVLAIGAFWMWPQALAIRLAGSAMVVAVGYVAWRQLTPDLGFIRLDKSGRIFASCASGGEFEALEAMPGASVHPWLTVIRFWDESGKRHTVLAARDTMNPDDFRRLRIFLRWRAKFSDSGIDA